MASATARPPRGAAAPAAEGDRAGQSSPVVVLAYSFSGSGRISRLLSGTSALACTSGTGLLPTCQKAAATWRQVDNRAGPPSSLAVSSIRALAGSMISVILANAGRSRWCEISFSPPDAAETFLSLYPGTKFICLHRSCPDVIRAGIEANPWGLGDTGIGQFAALYPGSNAAAIAAYWTERTEPLLRFEAAHPAACLRVRYEDLAGQPGAEAEKILAFLDLAADGAAASMLAADAMMAPVAEAGIAMNGAQVPAGHLPVPLRQRVDELQARLGYQTCSWA